MNDHKPVLYVGIGLFLTLGAIWWSANSKERTVSSSTLHEICAGSDDAACISEGGRHLRSGDVNLALFAFDSVCRRGNGIGCYNLGLVHQRLKRAPEAKLAFERACHFRDEDGCAMAGLLSRRPLSLQPKAMAQQRPTPTRQPQSVPQPGTQSGTRALAPTRHSPQPPAASGRSSTHAVNQQAVRPHRIPDSLPRKLPPSRPHSHPQPSARGSAIVPTPRQRDLPHRAPNSRRRA